MIDPCACMEQIPEVLLSASVSSQTVSSCRDSRDYEYEVKGNRRGLSVYVRFVMPPEQCELFMQRPPSYFPADRDVANMSHAEIAGLVHGTIIENIFSKGFKGKLIAELVRYRDVRLRIPVGNASLAADAYSFNEAWTPTPYWNWLRHNMLHVRIVPHKLGPTTQNGLPEWVPPVATALLGEDFGRDAVHPESIRAFVFSSSILIFAMILVFILRWQKSRSRAQQRQ